VRIISKQRVYVLHVLTYKEYDKEKWKMAVTAKPRAARSRTCQRFDKNKYGRLLARTEPAMIRNGADYRRVEAENGNLLRKGEHLTPEEECLLDLLSALVERYEDEHLIDCAMNAGVPVVTSNKRDLAQAQKALGLKVMTPAEFVVALTAPN
jgi:hypothetical protein